MTRVLPVPQDGYFREWLLIGPFRGDPRRLLFRSLVKETRVLPRRGQTAVGGRWTRAAAAQPRIDLQSVLPGW
jgi:hypothetical protein